jgi:hypothetical protein
MSAEVGLTIAAAARASVHLAFIDQKISCYEEALDG